MPSSRGVTLPAVVFPCLCIRLHSHKMELTFRIPNPNFPGSILNFCVFLPDHQFSEPYQVQWFVPEFAGASYAILNHITTLYDRLGHTLCKGPLVPNSSLQGLLFYDDNSPYDEISDGSFHDPNSYKIFSRLYPRNSYRRTFNNYLVRS